MFKLTAITVALALSQTSANTIRSRELSEEKFISYEPQTTVTDHAAIDLDQQMIETQLALGTPDARAAALAVYQQGAHSKSFAEISLNSGVASTVSEGAVCVGTSANGDEVRGTVMEEAAAGATTIKVQYGTSIVQDSYVNCQVGGSPEPNTEGCFAESGSMTIGSFGALPYTYNILADNKNGRTIQGFSHQAKEKMSNYDTYKKFYNYYGQYDYADRFVMAGFNNAATSGFVNGGADFSNYDEEAVNEIIKKGTAYLNVWMYVIREMEDAIDDCSNDCGTTECNDDQVHAWDEAVAFYTGSIPKADGNGGVLLYTLAQKRCANFGTCLVSGDNAGMAGVNDQIFRKFNAGKQALRQGKCTDASTLVAEITSLMSIPMIQGAMRYAHILGEQNQVTDNAEAEGVAFASAVLPLVHFCNAGDAKTIYDNLKTGTGSSTDFGAVKQAFENNYDCLGVKCGDVGGLLSADNVNYFEGAEPCGTDSANGGDPTKPNGGTSIDGSSALTNRVSVAVAITGIVATLF